MNVKLTSHEVSVIRNSLNGWKSANVNGVTVDCLKKAEASAKKKFERLAQADAAAIVRRVIHGKR